MTKLPKIALAKINGAVNIRECAVTPVDDGYLIIDTGEWYPEDQFTILCWLAVINYDSDLDTVERLSNEGPGTVRNILRQIATPSADEPPARTFLKDRIGGEWVMTRTGMQGIDGDNAHHIQMSWDDWCLKFGPGEVLS